MELEKLLNKLIEKGREPFGNYRDIITRYKYDNRFFDFNHEGDNMVSIRELVSKESGLWQFVCDKGLVEMYEGFYWQNIFPLDSKEYDYTDYQYWILESSLIDESELEKFLLENIKIDGE